MDNCDELFLVPASVLDMDSHTFKEDVRSVAPKLIGPCQIKDCSDGASSSSSSSCSASSSLESPRLKEDFDGLRLATASRGYNTLWLCELRNVI